MTEDEARKLEPGDSVEYHDGQSWHWSEVVEPLRERDIYPSPAVRIDTGSYKTNAAARSLRR